jgi:hypothetical protein
VATAEIKGSLTAENLILDFTLDDSRWFPISLPQTVAVSDVTIDEASLNVDVNDYSANCYSLYYDGAMRATAGAGDNWQWVTNSGSFEANKGYLIGLPDGEHTLRFTMPGFTFEETANKNVSVLENSSANAVDAGWNLIGNPYLQAYHHSDDAMTAGDKPLTAVVTLTADGEYINYEETAVSDAVIPPFSAVFIQSPATGSLVFESESASSNAPVRALNESKWQFLQLVLTGNGGSDKTSLIVGDYNEDYTIGADLVKWFNDNYLYQAAPTLYTFKGENKQAFNARSEEMMHDIPVGFHATAAGTYTFSLGKEAAAFDHVWLYDSEKTVTTDLKNSDYEFITDAGTIDKRFILSATPAEVQEIPTGVEIVNSEELRVKSGKFIEEGKLFIERDGRTYNAQGALVR